MTDSWRDEANCKDTHPSLFQPAGSRDEETVFRAQAVCAGCLVTGPCLEQGQQYQADGVWGGELLDSGRIVTAQFIRAIKRSKAFRD